RALTPCLRQGNRPGPPAVVTIYDGVRALAGWPFFRAPFGDHRQRSVASVSTTQPTSGDHAGTTGTIEDELSGAAAQAILVDALDDDRRGQFDPPHMRLHHEGALR